MAFVRNYASGGIMSHQLALADSEFSSKLRQTRKEIFLSGMEHLLPWQNMLNIRVPAAGNVRRSRPQQNCLPHRLNLSDGPMADVLPDCPSILNFPRLHVPHRQILHQK